jgi:GLPGLI family protein
MRRIIGLIGLILFFGPSLSAQPIFIAAGKIEYERKINVHKQFEAVIDEKDQESEWMREVKQRTPKVVTSFFDLYFNEDQSLYKPGRETDAKLNNIWMIGPAKENTVLTNFSAHKSISQKSIFEANFLLEDSLGYVQWKLEPEVRTIAGFECRKAVGIICDSVYVVAFYTDEISVSGGPESFHGLPGMILGIAIPRLYTTWFATKVEVMKPNESIFNFKPKGKKSSHLALQKELQQSSMKNWGKEAQRNLWWAML